MTTSDYPAEQWRPAPYPEYADCYAVSDYGRVKTLINTRHKRAGDLIALSANSDGYLYAAFFLKGTQRNFLVHRLVAKAFIGDCPDGMEIDHVDRDKTNNHISNLEYVTHFENIQRLGGKENIPTETIEAIRALYCDGWRRDELSLKFRLSIASIGRIVTNVRYYDPNYTYVKRYDPRTRERGAAKHTPPARTQERSAR